MIRYWNQIRTLFILPNSSIHYDLSQSEEYFTGINTKVYNIYKNRIKKYKSISTLYDFLLDTYSKDNKSSIDFCLFHKRCKDIKY